MKKLLLLLCVALIFSCGEDNSSKKKDRKDAKHETTNAKENGKEAGELQCEFDELMEEWDNLNKEQYKLDWNKGSEEDREKIADLNDDMRKIAEEMSELLLDISELNNNRWKATEGKDDRDDWDKAYTDAKKVETDKCEKK